MPKRDSAEQVIAKAIEANKRIATAESCTGGLVVARLSDVSGASAALLGGAVVYTEAMKERVLGLSPEIFENNGVYSHVCAKEMAQAAKELFQADVAIATTGIAGPTGELPDKPVGSVWIGIASDSEITSTYERFSGSRSEVREAAVAKALAMLHDTLQRSF